MDNTLQSLHFKPVLALLAAFAATVLAAGETETGGFAKRLEKMMDTIARKAERKMDDGTPVYSPDSGKRYRAAWLRDFCYAAESGRLPTATVVGEAVMFLNSLDADGQGVDCIAYNGVIRYRPGGNRMGVKPVTDGCQFTVNAAYLAWKQSHDGRFLAPPLLDLAVKTFRSIPHDPEGSGLVWIDPSVPYERCPYGFTDTVRKTGCCLFSSLLEYESGLRLAEMLDAAGRTRQAEEARKTVAKVKESVNRILWDEETGLYRAATVRCREHDVWGSAFAVWLGVAEGERARRIGSVFKAKHAGVCDKGQVRHLLPGVYWESAFWSNGRDPVLRDDYQNGGFWGTPSGWYIYALSRVDRPLALKTLGELVDDFEKNGVCEWHFGEKRACNDGYLASVGPLLAVLRRF